MTKPDQQQNLLGALGPGILYAATAIGVSHLVQATRGGAVYGLAMLAIVVLACAIKYPAIRFGSQYAAATGKSLPENYLEQGWWAFAMYLGIMLLSVWFVWGAVSATSAGLLKAVFNIDMNIADLAGLTLLGCGTLVIVGRYRWLERIGKYMVALLTVLVLIATFLVLPKIDWQAEQFFISPFNPAALFFIIAVAGWMPTPVDGAIMSSVWTSARIREEGLHISPAASRLDFNVGYITATVLALCFVILGTGVLHGPGVLPETSAGGFASQLIRLFTQTIGAWSYPIIATAAIATMLSTLLMLMDGAPRALVYVAQGLRGRALPWWVQPLLVLGIGSVAYLLLKTVLTSFAGFIDIATTLGFLTAPVYAILNHRAMSSADVAPEYAPTKLLRRWSIFSIFVLAIVSLIFVYFKWTGVG